MAAMVASCSNKEAMIAHPQQPVASGASIHYSRSINDPSVYYFALRSSAAPEELDYQWSVNEKKITATGTQFQHRFPEPGEYSVTAMINGEVISKTIIVNRAIVP